MIIIEEGKVELYGQTAEIMSDVTMLMSQIQKQLNIPMKDLCVMLTKQVEVVTTSLKSESEDLQPLEPEESETKVLEKDEDELHKLQLKKIELEAKLQTLEDSIHYPSIK